MTRRALLVTAAAAAVTLVAGRLWGGGASGHAARATAPRRADNLREQHRRDGVVLRPAPVDPRGPVYRLNRPASLVWHSLDGRRTADDIAALLAAAYGIPRSAARADTRTCLETFRSNGLVFGSRG